MVCSSVGLSDGLAGGQCVALIRGFGELSDVRAARIGLYDKGDKAMTNPTLERAAKAAFEELERQNEEAGETMWVGNGQLLARAVLMAIRDRAPHYSLGNWVGPDDADEFWARLIDAILADGGE